MLSPGRAEQAAESFGPIRELVNRLRETVLPEIAAQEEPTTRKAMLAHVEALIGDSFKRLDDLETDLRGLRRSLADLRKDSRRLRPRGKPRPRPRNPRKKPAHRPLQPREQVERDKDKVYAALPSDGRLRTLHELFILTGFGKSKLTRILRALAKDDAVERVGSTSGTRYRVRFSRGGERGGDES